MTHDYLVHSLRDWLTRKQRETRRGRAALRLAERAALWEAKPEDRHLPSALEWATIRALTRRLHWTDPQRRMMARAGRFHGMRASGLAVVAALVLAAGLYVRTKYEEKGRKTAAAGLVSQLLAADTPHFSGILREINQLGVDRGWAEDELKRTIANTKSSAPAKLHASLALVSNDQGQVPFLRARLLDAAPAEFPMIRDALATRRARLTPNLWRLIEGAKAADPRLIPAAGALAVYDPESPRWDDLGGKVADALATVNPTVLVPWLDVLKPVRGKLTPRLVAIFRDRRRPRLRAHDRHRPGRLRRLCPARGSRHGRRPESVPDPLPRRSSALREDDPSLRGRAEEVGIGRLGTGQGPIGRTPGTRGNRPDPHGSSRGNLVPISAWSRPAAP